MNSNLNPMIPQGSVSTKKIDDYLTNSHAAARKGWDHSEEVVEDQKRDDEGQSLDRGHKYSAPIVESPLNIFLSSKLKGG